MAWALLQFRVQVPEVAQFQMCPFNIDQKISTMICTSTMATLMTFAETRRLKGLMRLSSMMSLPKFGTFPLRMRRIWKLRNNAYPRACREHRRTMLPFMQLKVYQVYQQT